VRAILARNGGAIDPESFIVIYDRREHALERTPPRSPRGSRLAPLGGP